jgi:hypothetical protein
MADRVLGKKHDGYTIPWPRTQQSSDPLEAFATSWKRGIRYRDAIAIEQSPDQIDKTHTASGDACLLSVTGSY